MSVRIVPLAIDLYCGLGGWTEGLLAEGYEVIGFDIERHDYGTGGYPAQLVLQNVLTLHGSQFKDADLIVASPPCQAYSWARWNFGSFYLWGDVPALMPMVSKRAAFKGGDRNIGRANGEHRWNTEFKNPGFRFDGSGKSFQSESVARAEGFKTAGMNWSNRELRGQDFTRIAGEQAIKNSGGSWFNIAHNTKSGKGQNPDGRKTIGHANKRDGYGHTRHLTNPAESLEGDGVKHHASGAAWFDGAEDKILGQFGPAKYSSKSSVRKAASAAIAKIPFQLARHIAAVWKPA